MHNWQSTRYFRKKVVAGRICCAIIARLVPEDTDPILPFKEIALFQKQNDVDDGLQIIDL